MYRANFRKPNKYKNQPITIDGHKFPSRREANRYSQLSLLQKAGIIRDLNLQVPFELQPAFKHPITKQTIRAIKYIADFTYYDTDTGKFHIEDAKGIATDTYLLKKKLMLYRGNVIEEV